MFTSARLGLLPVLGLYDVYVGALKLTYQPKALACQAIIITTLTTAARDQLLPPYSLQINQRLNAPLNQHIIVSLNTI